MGHLDAKSGNFRSLNPLKNQRYECLMAFPAPYQGDFKRECISPNLFKVLLFSITFVLRVYKGLSLLSLLRLPKRDKVVLQREY